jgi:large subunit ribosomal protein L5|uniref:Ribosomal protein L5 n=1 Tax=Baffinella frigidus TaxID=2571260 RepID=A0A6C0X9U3_9CRYP|nr:ribosomal protein L5 [Cryptophyta sp. CCMP2293]
MNRLKLWYNVIVSKDLIYKLNSNSVFQIDRLNKLVLTCNTNDAVEDSKNVVFTFILLELLANQKPKIVRAKKSVATFKLRKSIPLGGKVTLRNNKMYGWIDLFIFVIQPKLSEVTSICFNLKEKTRVLALGIPKILNFPQLMQESHSFRKDFGLTLTIESKKKQKLSTILLVNGFQLPSSNKV